VKHLQNTLDADCVLLQAALPGKNGSCVLALDFLRQLLGGMQDNLVQKAVTGACPNHENREEDILARRQDRGVLILDEPHQDIKKLGHFLMVVNIRDQEGEISGHSLAHNFILVVNQLLNH